MEDYSKYPKGSEWRKWDLHIHTPASYYWNGKKLREMDGEEKIASIESFIDTIENSDIAVFCLMDYWNFDWFFELRAYLEKYPDKLTKTVFPGMELRVECPVDYRLNIHCILSDKLSNQELKDFKSELYIASIEKKLSDDALKRFAKSLDESKAEKHGFKNPDELTAEKLLQLGSSTAEITRESLKKAFNQIPPESGFVLLPYDTSDGLLKLDWSKHPAADNYFMQTASIFETRDQRNIDLFNGNRTPDNEEFFENFFKTIGEKPKPCISGSDAHSFKDYGKFPSDRITWIKADPSFEGLKQIIYEPKERVEIQETKPDEKKLYDVIDKVQFEDTDVFSPSEIQMNNNLTTIIGGKSTGKSILIRNIAKAIDKSEFDSRNRAVNISENKPIRGFKVIWNDGQLSELNNKNNPDKRVIYIPQSYLNRIVESDEKNNAIDEIIKDVLLQDDDYNTWNNKLEDNLKENNQFIRDGVSELFELFEKFKNLTKEIKEVGDKEGISKQISKLKKEVKDLQKRSNIGEEELDKFENLSERIRENKLRIEQLKTDLGILDIIKDEGIKITKGTFELFQLPSIKSEITQLATEKEKEFSENWKKALDKKISDLEETLKSEKSTLNSDEKEIKSLSEKVKDRKALSKKTEELEEERKREDLIIKLNKEREELVKNIDNIVNRLAELVSNYYSILIKAKDYVDLENFDDELQFDILTIFTKSFFESRFLEQFFDGRKLRGEEWDFLTQFEFKSKEEYREFVKDIIKRTISGNLPIRENIEKQDVLDAFLKNWFSHDYKVVYQGDELKDMSPGKKSFVLLRLLIDLDHSRCPILIDQPEDDLDNRSIYTQVVNFLREKKKERQIIIVTHNPNLVLGADAELVVVANQEGDDTKNRKYQFEYVSGSIEFTKLINDEVDEVLYKRGIQEHICEILEGGEEAFNKRKSKYSFTK